MTSWAPDSAFCDHGIHGLVDKGSNAFFFSCPSENLDSNIAEGVCFLLCPAHVLDDICSGPLLKLMYHPKFNVRL